MIKHRPINVVMPMAGRGQRFLDRGITTPKPLIKVGGKTIIEWILLTLGIPQANYIFIVREEHVREHALDKRLKEIVPTARVIVIDQITEGSICTVLLAQELINNRTEMIIKDCDQIINWNSERFLEFVQRKGADGAVVTIATQNPGFSFARLDADCQKVIETAEKRVISMFGCSGLYYFARGTEFTKYAKAMIAKNIRVNNEFYVSPVYNQYLEDGKLILNYPIAEMFSFNTPEELDRHAQATVPFLAQFGNA